MFETIERLSPLLSYRIVNKNISPVLCDTPPLFFRQFQYIAYKQYSAWVHNYEKRGHGHVVIPSWVIGKLKN